MIETMDNKHTKDTHLIAEVIALGVSIMGVVGITAGLIIFNTTVTWGVFLLILGFGLLAGSSFIADMWEKRTTGYTSRR